MIVDPVQALANVPTAVKHSSSTSPAITVLPTSTPIYQVASQTGERTLWIVFVIMAIGVIAFTAMAWSLPASKRLYHVITTFVVTIAALSYFAMASKDGISLHKIELIEKHNHGIPATEQIIYRQVYWARYVDWSLTTPLLLLDLSLLAGLSGCQIVISIVADLVMVLTGLFAAYGTEGTPQKWGWYAIGCVAYLTIVWNLVVHGRAAALTKGGKVGGFYASIAGFTLLLWTAYPIVWGIADGARNVDVDGEIIAYAVLDVLAKPVFGLWLLLTHMNMPETHVDLHGFWARGLGVEGTIRVGEDDDGA